MNVGTRVTVAGRPGMLSMDNEDGTWNVDFDDGTEGDIPMADLCVSADQSLEALLAPEKPRAQQLPEMASGIRIVTDPSSEPKPEGWTRFVCFSDTHGKHNEIPAKNRPAADVLLHAGDFTNTGEPEQVESLSKWLDAYPASHKIVIAGNHDITFHEDYYVDRGAERFHRKVEPDGNIVAAPYDCQEARGLLTACSYLEDSAVEVCGYTIYGSPWQPAFCDWAFNLEGEALREKWSQIPANVDILITHGPPLGFGDSNRGCDELRAAIEQRAVPVHVSGHIHEGYGCSADAATLYINASTCTHDYKATNAPIVFDMPPPPELHAAMWKAAGERRM